MRTLVLLRGAPGCGKSTFIKQHNLEPYTLCADDIRMQYHSTHLNIDGTIGISQQHDSLVWKTLFDMLEYRMSLGCFTVIDATNSKTKEMKRYKELASTYRYRVYVVDMTDVSLQDCIDRNEARPAYKRVPTAALENIYARFATQGVPSGIKVIKPEEFDSIMEFKPVSFNQYHNIHIFGDIHGCFTPLHKYMQDNWSDQDMYIFLGDYLDRGTENAEVFKYIDSIKDLPNVLLIEGNHERWLNNWGTQDTPNLSGEFRDYTMRQLQSAGIDKKAARNFYRKLSQCAYFTYGDSTYFCCHGGLSSLPITGIQFIPTCQMIKGVGRYSDYEDCLKWWSDTKDGNTFGITQLSGHRNINKLKISASPFAFNLEGAVEFGGDLRVVKLTRDTNTEDVKFEFYYIHNDVPVADHLLKPTVELKTAEPVEINSDTPISELVNQLRANSYVLEKQFGDVSSFNFTRDAFSKGIWDNQTIRARGLYIDTAQNKIFARSYDKFFKFKEMPETQPASLARTLNFPLKVYLKENGYLGLISYNYFTDDLFFTTKSSPTGDYTKVFKQLFMSLVSKDQYEYLKQYIMSNDCTLTVEVIDTEFDPHIIEYNKSTICCLDIVENTIDFAKKDYDTLVSLANTIGLPAKQYCLQIDDWASFEAFLDTMNDIEFTKHISGQDYVEGYVVEDTAGFMFKLKTDYYSLWKGLRGVANAVIKTGNYRWTGGLQTPLANYFYAWIKDNWRVYHDDPTIKCDIITLRNEFFNSEYYKTIEGQVN